MSDIEKHNQNPWLKFLTYPRGIVITFVGILHTLLMSVVVVVAAVFVRSRKMADLAIRYLWALPLVVPSGVRVDLRGAENVHKGQKGFLILFNHSSLFDIPVMFAYFPRSFAFGAKIELFKIPFFGRAMAAVGVLPIDRSNRNKVMEVYQQAIARVERGECFALAPEGTRQNEAQLGKFKRGPFEFALNAQMDIVPVVLAGVLKVLPKHSVWVNMGAWRRRVIVQVMPRISTQEYTMETVGDLQERVRAQMDEAFAQANAELEHSPS